MCYTVEHFGFLTFTPPLSLPFYPFLVSFPGLKNISFVFSGYAPLSVRLLELLDKPNGWTQFEEVSVYQAPLQHDVYVCCSTSLLQFTRLLPGPCFARTQPVPRGQEKRSESRLTCP